MKSALACLLTLSLALLAAPAAADGAEKQSTEFTFPYNSSNW